MKRRRAVKRRSEWSFSRILILTATFFIAAGFGTLLMSQTASAGLTKESPVYCGDAIKKALKGEQENDGPATDTFTGVGKGGYTLSDCFGAVMNEKGKQKKAKGQKLDENDYDCTGRAGTTTVSPGNVTSVTLASKDVEPKDCKTKVTNKGLDDKGKGGQPGAEKGKGEGKGEQGKEKSGGEGMPKLPEPPKGKEDSSGNPQPQPQQCQTEEDKKTKPECRGLQGGQSLMDTLLGAGKTIATNAASGAKSAFDGLWNALTNPAAAEPAASSPGAPLPTVPGGDSVPLADSAPASGSDSLDTDATGSYTPPASTGFGAERSDGMSLEEIGAAQEQLGGIATALQKIIDFLKFWD